MSSVLLRDRPRLLPPCGVVPQDLTPKRKQKVPESAYTDGPQGLK